MCDDADLQSLESSVLSLLGLGVFLSLALQIFVLQVAVKHITQSPRFLLMNQEWAHE